MRRFWVQFATDTNNYFTYESTRVTADNEKSAEREIKERWLRKGFEVYVTHVAEIHR